MSDYKIDKNIPIPYYEPYELPLREMQVGDSIEFPEKQRTSIASRASFLRRVEGLQFAIRKTGDGTCRVWRIK